MKSIEQLMRSAPIIPVLVIEDIEHALPIAEALVEAGLPNIEVTLRTPCATDAIRQIANVAGVCVGAGTVNSVHDLDAAVRAGAEFIVSPGLTKALGRAVNALDIPFLPGVANAADIMLGLELGLSHFKFFPAEANGGILALKALAGPFGQCLFCPTGGVTPDNAAAWLALDEVLCVGGSWLVPKGEPNPMQIKQSCLTALSNLHWT